MIRGEGGEVQLVRRKGQPKVSLGEPLNPVAKDVLHLVEKRVGDMHGGHGSFVHVDLKTGGFGEDLE
jgi:hypothetical protein